MRQILIFLVVVGYFLPSYTQTTLELYNEKNYEELVKFEMYADELTSDELYMIGFAFFKLENDNKAIEFFDKAITRGLNNGSVHFYKGLSLCYLEKFDDAMKEVETALKKEPYNQEFMNQKGLIYKYKGQEDLALEVFEQATKLPNTYGEPFFWVAYIYHGKQDFTKALDLYYVALDSLPRKNSYYVETLQSIGQLEYTHTKNFHKSADAYAKAIEIAKTNYELYYKLIKSYNAAGEYAKADSIYSMVKDAFEREELPAEDMETRFIAVAQFEWNGQTAIISKSLVDPHESLDISYKVFVLNTAGDKIERKFLVEKTIQFQKEGPKHLLCEQDVPNNLHITYPYGWSTDNIPVHDLEKAVKLVLDGKMKQGASSRPNHK